MEVDWQAVIARLVREGNLPRALALYAELADEYERVGFWLKSIAIARAILELTAQKPGRFAIARTAARRRLVRNFITLGLYEHALEEQRTLRAPGTKGN